MTKKMISIIGAAAMALGCFLPAIHAPLLGSVSFMIGADGQSVAAIGAVALILGLCGRVGLASIAGWFGLLIAGFDFFHFQSHGASDNPFVKMATVGEAWPGDLYRRRLIDRSGFYAGARG
jgi:hypothetical protein